MRAQSPRLRHSLYTLLATIAASILSLAVHAAEAEKPADADKPKIIKSHFFSMYGESKYPKGFKHFEYASPDAIKGGTFKDFALGTFDSLNPFVSKGTPAAEMSLIYDSLMTSSSDEASTYYGLIAEAVEYPEDRSWVIFHLNPKARFHDGVPIKASDVVFSFNTLIEKGIPSYAFYYADVSKAEALDDGRVKFHFKNPENRELILITGQIPVLPEHFWKDKDFEKADLEIPLGSGPYRVSAVDPGRSITYKRVPDYWGKDLPVNVGFYNFDTFNVDYYRDDTVAIEALKAGAIDFRWERVANTWFTGYDIPAVKEGRLIKEEIRDYSPRGMSSFILNLRRPPFDNMLFRQALSYAFDFEWTNRNIFHDSYTRVDSYFFNSELASKGVPQGRELEILKPFKDQLPPSVFTQPFENPKTDGSGNNRANLRKAQQLLNQAGYTLKQGKLIDPKTNKPVTFEILEREATLERLVNPYIQNLKRLGIDASMRMVDVSQYLNRVQSQDFDVVIIPRQPIISPGSEQRDYWTSTSADQKGSQNYGGVKNPVVDQLVELLIDSPDREELVFRTRALDRVMLHHHYVVPLYTVLDHRLVYWNKFGRPEISPKYDPRFSTALMTWWIDPAKERRLPKQAAAKAE